MMVDAGDLGANFLSGRVRSIPCPVVVDERGALLPLEFDRLPFLPRRLFTVAGTPVGAVRGGHAHRFGQQFLVCLQGQIEVLIRCDQKEVRVVLVPGGPGLLLGTGVWCRQTYLNQDSVLLVFSSEPYDPSSYIEDWD